MVHIHISTITNIFFLLISAVFGDPQRGREMARAVDLMLEKPGMERMKSRANFHNQGITAPWTTPWHGCLAPLLEGYH